MCLIINSKKRPKWLIADKAITVWKRVDRRGDRALPQFRTNYDSKLIYKLEEEAPRILFMRFQKQKVFGSYVVNRGYHSYIDTRINNTWTNAIFEIPEGAKYITDGRGELVSNRIKFIKWKE